MAGPRPSDPCPLLPGCGDSLVRPREQRALQQRREVGAQTVGLRQGRERNERDEARRQVAVEAKLDEYYAWAVARWAEAAQERTRLIGPRHLLTEHPLRTQSLEALARAVLDWAYDHSQDEELLRRSPTEVALYLLARRSSLATAIELGKVAPPHLDYTPLEDKGPSTEELIIELLYGLMPGLGELADAEGVLIGYSVTGRELDANERLLCAIGVLIPLVSGRALAEGGQWVERAALVTGRSLEEMRVLQRVASHLSSEDAAQVEKLLRDVAKGGRLSEEEVAFLRRVAAGLEKPLLKAAATLQRGGKVSLVGSRVGEAGLRLEPGTAEHMAAAWVDYQFRHPEKYSSFRFAIDADWKRKYELILKNKGAGGEFEQLVLQARKQEKNRAMMMPPPGSQAEGFIPDAVMSSPTPGELVWGQPYFLIEAKARQDLSLGGNLMAMLRYVEKYGGHVELWIRSPKHSEGATRLTEPLRDLLSILGRQGRASVRPFP
ncbi:hypothetical protein [Hyalangium versicolor]|uniref:hypothetical protein n=1 Tax=Hyalangium versicolor TaxID=2861190 RepID=UPI001CCE0BEF|nr:hypothetical protein [Hyalangium versicolor]